MIRPADLPASNHYHGHIKAQLLAEYAYLYPGSTISAEMQPSAEIAVSRAMAQREIYAMAASQRSIPWVAIAAADMRESGADPNACLANGDPWMQKTVHYPRGKGPWTSKLQSILWALDDFQSGWCVDFTKIQWTIPEILFFLECYNGFFPRFEPGTVPADASGYIYSGAVFEGTPLYERGKRKEHIDIVSGAMVGYFDATQVDLELGCMAFLLALEAKGINLFS